MSGKIIGIVLLISSIVAGAALYYLQVYGFYTEFSDAEAGEVVLISHLSDRPEPIPFAAFRAIDADSSPIRYRGCFTTEMSLEMLSETYVGLDNQTPRNAPGWFDCFDARAIAAELDAGTARMFLSQKNVQFGVDRVVAITQDGRGYIWHELNDCGEKSYDGTIVGEECPRRDK